MIFAKDIRTPIGDMLAACTAEGVCLFDFIHRKMMDRMVERVKTHLGTEFTYTDHPHLSTLEHQMAAYFSGERRDFDLPLVWSGTPFQQRVWQALLEIPYGTTRSYKQQSGILGDEKAIRAVAKANGENGIAIIVPCHRVIGTHGSLVGYGGGLHRKKWLLQHEAKVLGNAQQASLFDMPEHEC